jgi:hypothetical protein
MLKTNGSVGARELYNEPTSIAILGRSPIGTGNIGLLVYTITYEFSG